ncbi:MAG: FeoA family protein [Puniceicoccales bacterium]
MLPGQEVVLQHVAPLGDPIAITFAGQKISLRRSEAAFVEVETVA